jgi:hypothetical protein
MDWKVGGAEQGTEVDENKNKKEQLERRGE